MPAPVNTPARLVAIAIAFVLLALPAWQIAQGQSASASYQIPRPTRRKGRSHLRRPLSAPLIKQARYHLCGSPDYREAACNPSTS